MALPTNASKTRSAVLALALSTLITRAHAAILDAPASCDAAGSLQCRLDKILNLLTNLSIVLVVVLIVIIAFAIRVYLKNRSLKKLRP